MTNYEHVWGNARSGWNSIDYRGKYILNILTVFAWVGMIGFFIAAISTLLIRGNFAPITMLIFLAIWMACGIAAIRIRRTSRRFVTIIK